MKRHIGKIICLSGVALYPFSAAIGNWLTVLIKGKPEGGITSPVGGIVHSGKYVGFVIMVSVVLMVAGLIVWFLLGGV